MGDRKSHGVGSEQNRSARGRAQRESLARGGGKTDGPLEEDPARSLAAIPAHPRTGSGRLGKTRNRLRSPERWFARDAFRAGIGFASSKGSASPANGGPPPRNPSRR